MHLFVYGFSKILFEAKFPPVAGEKKKKGKVCELLAYGVLRNV